MKTLARIFVVSIAVVAAYFMCLSFGYEMTVCVLLGAILGNLQYATTDEEW